MCLVRDLLRRKTLLFTFLFHFFHVLIDENFHVHVVQVTVDEHLLDTSDHCTGDPVDTHTYRERKAEESGHDRHERIHGLHGIGHGLAGIFTLCCLRHQLDVDHLRKPGQDRDQNGNDRKKNGASGYNSLDVVPGILGNIQSKKVLHFGNIGGC